MTSACGAKIGIECQIYYFVHETLWLFVASMKQEVLWVEPTYERAQSIWVSEFALRDICLEIFWTYLLLPRNFPVSFSLLFSFGKEELGEGVRLFFEQIFYYLISTTLKCYQTVYLNTYTLLQQGKKRNRYFLGNSTWFKPKKCMKIKAEKQTSPKNNKKKINSLFWY